MNVPLYQRVEETIIARIVSGELSPGAMLPSETDLGRELGVSQGTARKALGALEQRGIVQRRQGRGTFVSTTTPEADNFHFFRLRRADGSEAVPTLEHERIARRVATEDEASMLASDEVFEIERWRSIDGRIIVREVSALPVGMFPGLDERGSLQNALYALYQRAYGIAVAQAQEELRAVLASGEEARLMDVAVGTPLIEVRRRATDISGRTVELRLSHYLTEDLHYAVSLR